MKFFISAWIGSHNLGDELILAALVRLLRAAGAREISCVSVSPAQTTADHGIAAVSHKNPIALLRAIYACDVFILGGGGLIQDQSSGLNVPYHFSRVALARLMGKPVLGIGLGAGPLSNFGGLLSRWLIGANTPLVVRDQESAELLQQFGYTNTSVTDDLVFSLPCPHSSGDPNLIGIAFRPMSKKKSTKFLPASMKKSVVHDDEFEAKKSVVAELARRGYKLRFIALENPGDDHYHRELAKDLQTSVEFTVATLDNIATTVGECGAIAGMRFHACVVALMNQRPTVYIGYSDKVKSLASRFNDLEFLVDDDAASMAKVPDLLAAAIARGQSAPAITNDQKRETLDIVRAFTAQYRGKMSQP